MKRLKNVQFISLEGWKEKRINPVDFAKGVFLLKYKKRALYYRSFIQMLELKFLKRRWPGSDFEAGALICISSVN